MKAALVLCASLCVVALVVADDETYPTKYDNVDLDSILNNKRLRDNYVDCLLNDNDSICTAEGKELKKHIRDALETECSKCSEKQKEGVEKVLRFLVNQDPEKWAALKAKYDHDGKYSKKYEDREKQLHE